MQGEVAEYLRTHGEKDFPVQDGPLKTPKRGLPDADEMAAGGCHR